MFIIVKLRQGSGKDRQGMALRRKDLKLKPLPYLMVRPGEAGGGKVRCVGSLWVTLGSLYLFILFMQYFNNCNCRINLESPLSRFRYILSS